MIHEQTRRLPPLHHAAATLALTVPATLASHSRNVSQISEMFYLIQFSSIHL